jgi:hypothetical protein
MRKIAKIAIPCFSLSLLISPAFGQATPAVSQSASYQGFELPSALGDLNYSLNASQFASSGYGNGSGSVTATSIGGDLGLLTNSEVHPFSLVYSGGYQLYEPTRPSSVYQSLGASQVYHTRRLTYLLSDSMSFVPQTPTTGLSGVVGVGDVGLSPISPGDGVLTTQASRFNNYASGSVSGQLNGPTSLSVSGTYGFLHFLGNDAANRAARNSNAGFGASLGRRLDALNSLSLSYNYSIFMYPQSNQSLGSQGLMAGWSRTWSRKLSTSLSAGPQRVSGVGNSVATYDVSVGASANYAGERGASSLSYSRGITTGNGLSQGATNDTLGLSTSRNLGPVWHGSAAVGFSRSVGLKVFTATPPTYKSVFASGQLNRGLGRHFSLFLSYSFEDQLPTGGTSSLALNGHSQTFSVGMSYSPMAIHFGGH